VVNCETKGSVRRAAALLKACVRPGSFHRHEQHIKERRGGRGECTGGGSGAGRNREERGGTGDLLFLLLTLSVAPVLDSAATLAAG
jgi:hypothetical protein